MYKINMYPLVSVVIPTYKRPIFLKRAIDSVLNQSYTNYEIIVVDDNNPDSEDRQETEFLMKQYTNNQNVMYVKHPFNKNGSAARNTGVNSSHGEFIMFLDDDDEFCPNKIENQINRFNSLDNSWGVSYSRVIYKSGNKIVGISKNEREGALLVDALSRNLFIAAGSNLMIRRDLFFSVGGFDESFVRNQDLEFLVRILSVSKIAFVSDVGLIVNLHDSNRKIDFLNITYKYYETFQNEINKMTDDEKSRIFQNLNLQVFRYFLISGRFTDSFRLIRESYVNFWEAFFYLLHLLKRYIMKYSCGYHPHIKMKCKFCLENYQIFSNK